MQKAVFEMEAVPQLNHKAYKYELWTGADGMFDVARLDQVASKATN
jgi:hypothetical protein